MAFRSWRTASAGPPRRTERAEEPPREGQKCAGLARVLARVYRDAKPEVLFLGPLCGESAVYLASRGARVHVDEFEPPPPLPKRKPGEPEPPVEPFRLHHPDGQYALVLAWEAPDFVPPDRLAELGSELKRILKEGGGLFLLSHARPEGEVEPPPRYRLLADDLIVREESGLPPMQRFVHPIRELERALAGFAIQGVQLQRNQMREIAAVRAGVESKG